MKDVRIDEDGATRCWNCGAKNLTPQRTFRSKIALGVGAVLTKKKLRCPRCGEYNDVGNGQPYDGPAKRKYRKEYEEEMAKRGLQAAPAKPELSLAEEIGQLAELRDRGVLTAEEFDMQKAKLLDN